MRLNALKLENFRQHPHTELLFHDGLTGIMGPNGAGKTTILEGIAYALYGMSAVRGKKDFIKFTGAPARDSVSVELDFDLAGHRYRVVRGLTSAEVFLDGAEEPIANSTNEVNRMLQQRLGMSCGEFFHTYFTGQKELAVMSAMTPMQRGQFLSRVLGYEKLRVAQDRARDYRLGVERELKGLRAGMPDPDAVTKAASEAKEKSVDANSIAAVARERQRIARETLTAIEPRWTVAQRQRDQSRQLASDILVAGEKEGSLARDGERIAGELRGVEAAKLEIKALLEQTEQLDSLRAESEVLDSLYREDGRRIALIGEQTALEAELSRLRERHERIARAPELEGEVTTDLEQKRAELEEAAGLLEAQRTAWIRDKQEAETKLEALRAQYTELQQQRDRIVALGENGECPTCSRPLGESMHTVVDHLNEQLEAVEVDGAYFRKRFEQLADMPEPIKQLGDQRDAITQQVTALERKLARVQEGVRELSTLTRELEAKEQRLAQLKFEIARVPLGYDEKRHNSVKQDMEQLLPLAARAQKLSGLPEREPSLRREHAKVSAQLAAIRQQLGDLRALAAGISHSEPEFLELKSDFESAATAARAAELAVVSADAAARTAGSALASAQATADDLKRTQEKLDAMQSDVRLHAELDLAFRDMRQELNQQLRPEVSELASGFLAELTDSRYTELELDDEYNVLIIDDGIRKPVLSGGEEDLANLVLRLAISQMIAERAGQSFSLLVLDEVFGSLDELRRFNVIELLRRLQDRFEQVILITHIESVRDRVDHVINVRFNPDTGASVVDQSDGPERVSENDVRQSLELQAAGAE